MLEQDVADGLSATNTPYDPAERSLISIAAGEKPRIIDQVQQVIRDDVFHRDGRLVNVRIADGEHVLAPLTREALDDLINRRCCFMGYDRRGNDVQLDAPKWIAETIHGLGEWPRFREIRQVTAAPFLRPDGSVGGLEPGYDVESRVWADVPEGLAPPPENPTDEDARVALAKLLDVVDEFPFESPASKAVYLSAVLTIVARRHIDGAVPLFVVDASKSGSGKTLLARIIAIIGTGTDPGLANSGANEAEFRKSITSFLLSGQPVMILDNQVGRLGGEALDRLLTSGKWTDRLLNHNRVVTLKNDIVTIVTSNNAVVGGDTCRRSLSARLVPECEYPENREFRRTDLLRHVEQNCHELTLAAITILRWQIANRYPTTKVIDRIADGGVVVRSPVRPFGSFEGWSRLVRQAVIHLDLPDPVGTQATIRELDDQAIADRRFVTALANWKPDWSGTTEELVRAISSLGDDSELRRAFDGFLREEDFDGKGPMPNRVGYRLRALRDRRFGSWAIVNKGDCRNGARWGLRCFDGFEDTSSSSPNNPRQEV
jgi:hypothetical protein